MIWLYLLLPSLYAQLLPKQLEVLKEKAASAISGTSRAKYYYEIDVGYRLSEIDSGLHYTDKAIALSKLADDPIRAVDALDVKGFILLEAGDIPGSLKCQLDGFKILEDYAGVARMASLLN